MLWETKCLKNTYKRETKKKNQHQGLISDGCQTRNVTCIFKNGGKKMAGNYRLISLTSLVGKILESIISY